MNAKGAHLKQTNTLLLEILFEHFYNFVFSPSGMWDRRYCNTVTAEQISCVLGWLNQLVFKAWYLGQQQSTLTY